MHAKQEICMSTIGPRELLLLLIGLDDSDCLEGLGGITRIQKLLYILQTEEHILPAGDGFKFERTRQGPTRRGYTMNSNS